MDTMNCLYCNAEIGIEPEQEKVQCKYCGRWIALPSRQTQEQKGLMERATQKQALWRFEEAEADYEALLKLDPDDADTHWKALLCHYGVEYVVEPSSGKSLPTVTHHEAESIFDNEHYKRAVALTADEGLRKTYLNEATRINGILQLHEKLVATQKPYDVFISVKQGDEAGRPTNDSFEALKLAVFLEENGLRVFNSRKSLSEMVGLEYEPYIMTALLSAQAMVVVASSKEAMEARWVRNEWRRFRWLQENDQRRKRLLIPYLLGMSTKDVPVEMQAIQCVSNTSASPYSDILHVIRKVIPTPVEQARLQARRPDPSNVVTDRRRSAIAVGDGFVAGLRTDGTVLIEGKRAASLQGAFSWKDIVSIAAGQRHLAGLRRNGSVVAVGDNSDGQCNVADMKGIVSIAAAGKHTICLGQSGAVYATGNNRYRQIAVEGWKDVVSIATARTHTLGLRSDGRVLSTGDNRKQLCNTSGWTEIESVIALDENSIGLRQNGEIYVLGVHAERLMKKLNRSKSQLVTCAYDEKIASYINLMSNGKAEVMNFINRNTFLVPCLVGAILIVIGLILSSISGAIEEVMPVVFGIAYAFLAAWLIGIIVRQGRHARRLRVLTNVVDAKGVKGDFFVMSGDRRIHSLDRKTSPQWLDIGLPNLD